MKKVLILTGLITAAMTSVAAASESTLDCQLDDTRRATQPRVEAPAAPAPNTARPTAAPRETAEQAAPRESARRRGVKRIPDAELIGPRGAL